MTIRGIKKSITLAFVLILIVNIHANTIIKGPYLSNVTTSSIRITWETTDNSPTHVDYADERHYGSAETFDEHSNIDESVTHHTIQLTSLSENVLYYYQVTSGDASSDVYHFYTAVNTSTPFSFIAFGDTRSDSATHQSIVDAMISYEPRFVLNSGDLVADGFLASDFQTFFNINKELMANIPYYPAIGNHEIPATFFHEYFELPNNEKWYSFRYGNCKFIVLDSSIPYLVPFSEQPTFLENELIEGSSWADFIFVMFHHPPYSSGNHGSELTLRYTICPIIEEHGVFMVFNGHDHAYEHGLADGVHYIVTGGGGAGLYSVGYSDWTVYSERTYHFCYITVDGTCLNFKAIRLDGTVMDSLSTCPLKVEEEILPVYSEIKAYPNPFNKKVTVSYTLKENSAVDVAISNILGEKVAVLNHGWQKAGNYEVSWNGHDDHGTGCPAGIYFAEFKTGNINKMLRLVLLK
ncbi:metallophosphoesterase [bacterium]|nr:metallophosphoesterase [bacterium]